MKLYVPLILAVISTVLVIYTLHESYDLNVSELTFGDFQIHPASMGTFFEIFFYVLRLFFNVVDNKQVWDSCFSCPLQR